MCEIFYCEKCAQVTVVGNYMHFICCTFYIVLPMLTGLYYCEHFWLAHPVILLGQLYFLRPKFHRVPLSCCLKQLQNDRWYCKTGRVRFNYYFSNYVIMNQNWRSGKEMLKLLKCFLCLLCEAELLSLEFVLFSTLKHVWKVYSHLIKCINKPAVEICKPKKLLNVSEYKS